MSAIAGILGLDVDTVILEQMLETMKNRGRKFFRAEQGKNFALLYSENDGSPLDSKEIITIDWAGETYSILFDGYIFNREEIKQKFPESAFGQWENSDAALMLRGYLRWGADVLSRVNGVFAIAILHHKQNQLFLARDRLGVRPMFYMLKEDGILFGSEIKTILAHPSAESQLDRDGISELLLLGPGRTPGSAIFKGICALQPGQYGIFSKGNLQLRTYWELKDRVHSESFAETVEIVRELVIDSIRRQLPVDNNFGTMLSGGLDSSIVSAICARDLEAQGHRLKTFSLDYLHNDQYFIPGRFQPNMDTDYIRIMLSHMDCDHHWTVLDSADLVDEMFTSVIARDLPGMADIDSSLLSFCRKIRPYQNVVLSGECADEIFGGYPWYREADLRDHDGFPWAQTLSQRMMFLPAWLASQIDAEDFVRERYRSAIQKADILPDTSGQDKRIKELTYLNIHWFMQTLLERSDRMGAMAGVEIRVPFCDYRIAEYLYSTPWHFKDYKGMEKGLLRKAMEGILPDSVLYRKKSPFPKTHDPAYLEIVSGMLARLLEDKNAPIFQMVDRSALENLVYLDFPYPWYGQLMRRPQTIVYMLQINYWLKHYSVKFV